MYSLKNYIIYFLQQIIHKDKALTIYHKTPLTIISDTSTSKLINKSVLFAQLDKFFDTFG